MPQNLKIAQYWDRISRLSYPEYALNHVDDTHSNDANTGLRLNLSLWNNDLPIGVAEATMRALPTAVGMYRSAQDATLITLLARRLQVERGNIIITAGADDALRVVSHYCIRPGTKTLIPVPCFGRYAYHAMIHEAQIRYLRFDTYPYEFDVPTIITEIHRKKIECIFIASPNNPTGHALDRESLTLLLDTVSCAVILDESLLLASYGLSGMNLINDHPNLFICGSFSKLYGLPGLRVGYLIASRAHAPRLRKLLSPFGVDALGLEIAKYMVVQDDWLQERISATNAGVAILRSMESSQFRVTHTSTSVALIEYMGTGGNLYRMLHDQGVTTVAGEEFLGLDKTNAVRVIIRNMNDMLRLKRILANIS